MCLAMKQIIAEENAKIIERMTKEKEEAVNKAVNEAVLLNNIQLVCKGKLSSKDAAEACFLTEEEFLKKKEEYEKTLA